MRHADAPLQAQAQVRQRFHELVGRGMEWNGHRQQVSSGGMVVSGCVVTIRICYESVHAYEVGTIPQPLCSHPAQVPTCFQGAVPLRV